MKPKQQETERTERLENDYKNGVILWASVRTGDLINAIEYFLDSLERERPNDFPETIKKYRLLEKDAGNDIAAENDGYEKDEIRAFYLEDLFDLLNEIAPENCYFGANNCDGADFGFWETYDY